MPPIHLAEAAYAPLSRQPLELVERKGLGHPDSMCDAIMEAISVALSQAYIERTGQVLHHNLDKGLLVAGQSSPALGGGRVDQPMRLIIGDRATLAWHGQPLPVHEIAEHTARQWLTEHLRFVDPAQHVRFQHEMQPGAVELVDLFARDVLGANDTSAAVGYAPFTETECCVLAAERWLNSPACKAVFPEAGEDVKIMAYRQGRHLTLTVAVAFVDRFIPSAQRYFECKAALTTALHQTLAGDLHVVDDLTIQLNTLDNAERGLGGMYLTVLGTSAESGDSGQVGRGNRVNGLISLHRPMSTEAAAGKNPVSHVGKIYNVLSHHMAHQIYEAVEPVEEVYLWLGSQIGQPLAQPWILSAEVVLTPGVTLNDVRATITDIMERELAALPAFITQLIHGVFPIY